MLNDQLLEGLKSGESTELVDLKKIDGTPFCLLFKDGLYFVIWGKYLISDGFTDGDECLDYASWENWDFVLNVMFTVCCFVNDSKTN
jgi:hypothetical protein